MNNLSIGRYIPGNSWLHKLDPKIKIVSLFLLLIGIFIIPVRPNISYLYLMLGFLGLTFILIISTKLPLGKVISGLKPVLFLLTFTVVIQLLYIRTGNALYGPITFYISASSIGLIIIWLVFYHISKRWIKFRILYFFFSVFLFFLIQYYFPYVPVFSYDVTIYDESLLRSGFIFLRIANIIMLTSLLTFTTMTTDLNYGLEAVLKPLKIFKFPVDIVTMMISLTLRYIPTLLEETEKIMKAQASRGVDFRESKFREKINQIISLLIPVFVISFKRSEDLSNAMEVRGYVIGQKRTRIDEYRLNVIDFAALILSLLLFGVVIVLVYVL
jgi:energy-coupling factor transport system permease protein